jgi:hypothetical protein
MVDVLLTDPFADWFARLDDPLAEDVATALDVVEQLGVERAPPASRSALLWYEHPSVVDLGVAGSLAWQLERWGAVHDYASRVLGRLESPRFVSRLARATGRDASRVLSLIADLRRIVDPRFRWALGDARSRGALAPMGLQQVRTVAGTAELEPRPASEPADDAARERWMGEDPCAELRQRYFDVLEAAGFAISDVPAYTGGLQEIARRMPVDAYRLLYGVDVQRGTALFVLGERLDRSFYGDSVRRAERMWQAYLTGTLHTTTPSQVR